MKHSAKILTWLLMGAMVLTGTACGSQKTAEQESTVSASESAAETSTEAATEAVTESSTEAAAETSTEASTEAATEAATEASSEAATEAAAEETAEGDPYDLGIDYSDDCVNTLQGEDALMQIVIIGDSQFGNFKGFDGMAYLLSKYCDANVYNLAIGGTTAALPSTTQADMDNWDSVSGIGMTYAITGRVDDSFIADSEKYEYQSKVYNGCDFSKTDVFIIEYGINDFMGKVPIDAENWIKGYRTTLKHIYYLLSAKFPDAQLCFCGPGYAQFFDSDGSFLGDSNSLDYGYGTLYDYASAAHNVVDTMNSDIAFYMNPYDSFDISMVNAQENLLDDGIHMNAENREKYAQLLARLIIRREGYSIGEGEDPSQVDWESTKQQ